MCLRSYENQDFFAAEKNYKYYTFAKVVTTFCGCVTFLLALVNVLT